MLFFSVGIGVFFGGVDVTEEIEALIPYQSMQGTMPWTRLGYVLI